MHSGIGLTEKVVQPAKGSDIERRGIMRRNRLESQRVRQMRRDRVYVGNVMQMVGRVHDRMVHAGRGDAADLPLARSLLSPSPGTPGEGKDPAHASQLLAIKRCVNERDEQNQYEESFEE